MTEKPVSHRPPLIAALLATLIILLVWGGLRIAFFSERMLPLTYTLPLLIGVWHRRTWILWSMAAACLGLAVVEIFWIMPDDRLPIRYHWIAFAGQLTNIFVAAAITQAIMYMRAGLEFKAGNLEQTNAELESGNEELTAREEETVRQNEELKSQAEELEQQTEELQTQSEELQSLNEEMTRRENMLQALLESARSLTGEREVVTELCRTGLQLIGGAAVAAAIVEKRGEDLAVHAHIGFGAEGPVRNRWGFGKSFAALVMKHGQTAFIENLALRPDLEISQPQTDQSLRSVLASPIRVNGAAIGAVEFYSAAPHQWTQEQFRLAEWVAAQCSLILETLRLQNAVRESSQRLKYHVENSPLGVVEWSGDYRITLWTREAQRIFGWTAEEVLGKRIDELHWIHEDDLEQVQKLMADMVKGIRPRTVSPNRNYRKDGSIVWCEWYNSALADASGQLVSVLSLVLDVTARKHAEAELRDMALFPDQNPFPILRIAADGELLYANKGSAEWLAAWGCQPGRMTPDSLHRISASAMQNGSPVEVELSHEQRTFSFVFAPIADPGYVNVYGRDITERKRAAEALIQAKEDAESANRTKDHFLAVLSHELRTPLTPVLAVVSELAHDSRLPEGVCEDLRMIHRNVEMEARLIDDLLDLTRIARGKLEIRHETTDAHAAIERAVHVCCTKQVQERGLTVQIQLAATDAAIWGDASRLQQVFWNLINNALKFSPDGAAITVRSENIDGRLRVQFVDRGAGIKPDLLPRLFNAFEQGGAGTTRQFGGLGLGLAISKAIVEMHGGTISASSDGKNLGATFTVELPLASIAHRPASCEPCAAAAPHPTGNGSGDGLHILVVEDHMDTARILGRLLQGCGHHVRIAHDVASALALATQARPDLLISDLGLPDGTGHQLMRDLRGRYPLKGIALSGYGMEDDVRRSIDAGFAEHLTKPVDFGYLLTTIGRVARA